MTNKFEFKNRKIAATAIEESLPFAAGFLVEQMRAAVFAKTARTLRLRIDAAYTDIVAAQIITQDASCRD